MANLKSVMKSTILALALTAFVYPAVASAQGQIYLTPYFASYYATSSNGLEAGDLSEKQENGPGLGAALGFKLSQVLGIEAAYTYVSSGTNISGESTGAANLGFSGNIMFANARATITAPRSNFYGLAGVGIVMHGGNAWEGDVFTKLTSFAGVLGLGIQADVSPKVRIDVKVEAQLYSFDPDGGDGDAYASKFMPDIMVTIGFPLFLKR